MQLVPTQSKSPNENATPGQKSTIELTVILNRHHSIKPMGRPKPCQLESKWALLTENLSASTSLVSSWEALWMVLVEACREQSFSIQCLWHWGGGRGDEHHRTRQTVCSLHGKLCSFEDSRRLKRWFIFWSSSPCPPHPRLHSIIWTHRMLQIERQSWGKRIKMDAIPMLKEWWLN